MKKLLIGLLALGCICANASTCNVSNLWLNFENEVEREAVIDAIRSKGYTIDLAKEGLSVSIGFQKEDIPQRQERGFTQAEKNSLGLVVENTGIALSNVATNISDGISHALKRKRSEHLIIANNGEALFTYNKKLGRLSSNKSRVSDLLSFIPECEKL